MKGQSCLPSLAVASGADRARGGGSPQITHGRPSLRATYHLSARRLSGMRTTLRSDTASILWGAQTRLPPQTRQFQEDELSLRTPHLQASYSWMSPPVLPGESQDQLAERPLERRPPWPSVRVCPPAGDELAVPGKWRLGLEREDRPGAPRKRAAQRRQQRGRLIFPVAHRSYTDASS